MAKTKKTVTKPQGRGKRSTRPAPAAPAPLSTPAPVAKPRPAVARTRRASATAAARRGAELTRYLRIHTKRPYGKRGEEAIRRLAVEVAHLGRLELGATATVAEN